MDIYLHRIPQSVHVSIFFAKKGETWFRGSTEKKYQRFTEQYTATRPEWNNEADNEAFRTRFSALFLILCDGSVGDA